MKIEKLPSGSYRIRRTIKGKSVSIVLPYKPSQKEAVRLLEEKWSGRDKLRMTFDKAAEEYIEGKRNTLSPSTIRTYGSIRRELPDRFKNMQIGEITSWDVQKVISDISAKKKPKTVRNYHGFISGVLTAFMPDTVLHTNLPQKIKSERRMPTDDEVNLVLEAAKGTNMEIPIRLACYGLRRSEICALTPQDLSDDVLTINKALVRNEDNEWILKTTKTAASTRTIILDQALCELIRNCDKIYDGNPDNMNKLLQDILDDAGVESFTLHSLRHYFASTAHAMGMPDVVVMASGGWKTDSVMKRVYRHEKKNQVVDMQRQYAARFHDNI